MLASFASVDEQALGYDPTVRHVNVANERDRCKIQYEYIVDGRTFVTTGVPLFDFKANVVEGCAM